MKFLKIAFAAAAVLIAATELTAKSGVEVGYMGTTYNVKINEESDNSDLMSGFYVGYRKDWNLVAGLSLNPGLYYSFAGEQDSKEELGIKLTNSISEHNLNLPVDLKYTFDIIPAVKVYVFAGPTFSVGLARSNKIALTGELLGQSLDSQIKYNYYSGKISSSMSDDDLNAFNSIIPKEQYNRFDIMLGGGVGVDLFKFITVKGGYDYGLMNRYKGSVDGIAYHRSQFYVSVGINF